MAVLVLQLGEPYTTTLEIPFGRSQECRDSLMLVAKCSCGQRAMELDARAETESTKDIR
jgi:hypothetical protein